MGAVLKWKGEQVFFESLTWEGTDTQCSRHVIFTVAANPYRSDIGKPGIKLGDLVSFYFDGKQKFVGIVTGREKGGAAGTWSYTAADFLNHLLRSTATYKFREKTAEQVTAKVCGDLKIQTEGLAKTKYAIPKLICEDMAVYDIIIRAYRKAKGHTGKKYMPVMKGKKVSVITKGTASGVTLSQDSNITDASYSDTIDRLIDRVRIYSEKGKQLGKVENKKHVKKYGIFQAAYTKEKKVSAKKAAEAMLSGVAKEAEVTCIGDIRAVSGYSLKVHDKATGLDGKFYITSDCHTFENGTHTMRLSLAWKNEMENAE